MCGIAGYSGSYFPAALFDANEVQSHRGPDGGGTWFDPVAKIGLAHRRLSIIDLSPTGAQPMASADEALMLVFNGEIYNFRELRTELEASGHHFRGRSDTEVLLHLYLTAGEDMLSRLNGIFAFAIWDKRKQSLFLARDALGVKPLYYTETSHGFAFASEMKALLCFMPETRELDAQALHRYLSFLWCPGSGTPLKGVRKLMPGEAMVVREGKVSRHWLWYDLPVFRTNSKKFDKAGALIGTVDCLREAVHRQLVADVPVGAFLSGGLDSSAIVTFAKEHVPDIHCFTIELSGGTEEGMTDDLPYARRVARHLGVHLDVVKVDAAQMAAGVENMITQLGEPLADPAPLNVLFISQLARDHGMKVLLSGAGGDDLFSGYRRHAAVHYEHLWAWLPKGLRLAMERSTSHLDQRTSVFRRLTKLLNGASLDSDERLASYFTWAREPDLRALYSPDFLNDLAESTATEPLLDYLKPLPASVEPLDRMLALEQRFFLADHNLTYTDRMSMAVGVEVRVPFLDLDLVEHAARIPHALKQHGKVGKWILKKAMEPYLPADVIYRPKTGFGAPLRRWMRHELRPLLRDILSSENLKRRGLFRPDAVHRLIAQNESGQVDAAYTLLSLLSIELWCRAFVDVPSQNN